MRSLLTELLAAGLLLAGDVAPVPSPTVETSMIDRAAKLRVFFGHQSVGGNIVEGVRAIAGSALPVREVQVNDPAPAADQPGLVHAKVGVNEQPLTKLADFEKMVDARAEHLDVAMVKLCYIDFAPSTDADALFKDYQGTLARLEKKHPSITFVPVTVPLTVVQGGVKGWVKRRLGNAPWGEQENVKRNAFNEKLRAAYPKDRLFDVALLEATKNDGSVETTVKDGVKTPALRTDYTDDGAHLNPVAQRKVGAALIELLGKLPSRATP